MAHSVRRVYEDELVRIAACCAISLRSREVGADPGHLGADEGRLRARARLERGGGGRRGFVTESARGCSYYLGTVVCNYNKCYNFDCPM